MRDLVLSVFLVLICCTGRDGLSNIRVSVPSIVLRGETTSFNCSYDVEPHDKIWAVKWYRGNIEILRFIRDESPPIKIFPLEHFHIDELLSNGRTLWLRNVNFHNSGEYSCEVVAERTFLTLIKKAHMQVVDLPDDKPRLTGIKEKYQIGETLEAMCTSWQSHPPANLTWFINEEPARSDYLKPMKIREEYDETMTSVLQLRFEISPHHFRDGAIKLKCTSSLLTIYWQSSMVELHEATPRLGKVLGVGLDEPATVPPVTASTNVSRPVKASNSPPVQSGVVSAGSVHVFNTLLVLVIATVVLTH